jgi:hypothetical protein
MLALDAPMAMHAIITSAATIDDGTCDFSCFFDEFICGQGSIWNANTAQCEVSCLGDLNNNGTIAVDDLLVFLSFFASVCP